MRERQPIAVRDDFVVLGGVRFIQFDIRNRLLVDLFGLRVEVSWVPWYRRSHRFGFRNRFDQKPPWDRITLDLGVLFLQVRRAYSGYLAGYPFWGNTLDGLVKSQWEEA